MENTQENNVTKKLNQLDNKFNGLSDKFNGLSDKFDKLSVKFDQLIGVYRSRHMEKWITSAAKKINIPYNP